MINTSMSLARISVVLLSMVAAGSAYAATTIVYPTGVNPTDVTNVQNALNTGGTVLLKAVNQAGKATSFNFGSWNASVNQPANSYVSIAADVTVTGESVGANRTTISGGVSPIYEAFTNAKASFSGIKFVNPQWCAFNILRSNGITISNCEVAGVLPFLNGSGYTESSGIYLYGPNTIAGNVNISGTYIHGLDGQYEFGIKSYGISTTTNLVGNTILVGNAADATSGTVDCEAIAIAACPGTTNITGNNVQLLGGIAYEGIAAYGTQAGAVNIVGNEVSVSASAITHEAIGINGSIGASAILANSIQCDSSYAEGIALVGDATSSRGTVSNVTVGLNVIDIANSYFGAIGLYGSVAKNSISLNLITGSSYYGVSANAEGDPSNMITSNSFLTNLFLGYSATGATLFFDTNTQNNVWRGPYTSVINNGTGNSISKSLF
jgi:hypothetical protein